MVGLLETLFAPTRKPRVLHSKAPNSRFFLAPFDSLTINQKRVSKSSTLSFGRAAGNRTQSTCSQSRRTTGILQPEVQRIFYH